LLWLLLWLCTACVSSDEQSLYPTTIMAETPQGINQIHLSISHKASQQTQRQTLPEKQNHRFSTLVQLERGIYIFFAEGEDQQKQQSYESQKEEIEINESLVVTLRMKKRMGPKPLLPQPVLGDLGMGQVPPQETGTGGTVISNRPLDGSSVAPRPKDGAQGMLFDGKFPFCNELERTYKIVGEKSSGYGWITDTNCKNQWPTAFKDLGKEQGCSCKWR
jgi:uncharacterized protein YcfL